MYGYFKCTWCTRYWKSANVFWNRQKKRYWGQKCQRCYRMNEPYEVEETECSQCGDLARYCDCDKTHINGPRKPHRSALCEKCLKGQPCRYFNMNCNDCGCDNW